VINMKNIKNLMEDVEALGVKKASLLRIFRTIKMTKVSGYGIEWKIDDSTRLRVYNTRGGLRADVQTQEDRTTYSMRGLERLAPGFSIDQILGPVKKKIVKMLWDRDLKNYFIVSPEAVPGMGPGDSYDKTFAIVDPAGQTSQSVVGTARVVCKPRQAEVYLSPTKEESGRYIELNGTGRINYRKMCGV
jgi:hypothetical protein